MILVSLRFCILAVGLLLCGCGQLTELVQYAGTASDAQDRNDRVAALANTGFAVMPVTGSVSYAGHASVVYAQNGAEVALLGQANVTANFDTGAVAGRVDQVFGGSGLSDLQNYAGALTFDGQIGQRRPNSFDATIAGVLTAPGRAIAVNGPLLGDFRGGGAQALVAMTTGQTVTTVNGATVPVRVRIAAED